MVGIVGKISGQKWLHRTKTEHLYKNYQPNKEDIQTFKELISNKKYNFIIFGSNNCQDCHKNIPKILKIFNEAELSDDNYSLYVLDNNLKEPSGFYKKFDIPTTPSLFIYNDNKEIGLVTYPYYNWLEMMLDIIREDLNEN